MDHREHDFATQDSAEFILRPEIQPTPGYDENQEYRRYIDRKLESLGAKRTPTESDVLGPYFRKRAPFRAKITPPNEPGTLMVISGRIWGIDSRRPVTDVHIDIWQANAQGHYDNEDPKRPPAPNSFENRARLVPDEHGYYEYETIHPGAYKMDANTWRSPHIHYKVQSPGYKTLVTQLFFAGDPYEDIDPFYKRALTISLMEEKLNGARVQMGVFDIILAPPAS